jgi:general stress protein 26
MASKDAPATTKLWDMIKHIRVAMLTSDDGPVLRSRPMIAVQDAFEGTLWFFTRADSHKVAEVAADDRVAVSYADPERQIYVSLSGRARLELDRARIRAHWAEDLRDWFPGGPDDPATALLGVSVEIAESWDAPSARMLTVHGHTPAALPGEPPKPAEGSKVRLA